MPNANRKYSVVISTTAQKQLDKLADKTAEPIIEAINNIAINPRPHGYIKLKNCSGYRIRVGNYRILYDIYDKILTINIIAVGDRKEIYK